MRTVNIYKPVHMHDPFEHFKDSETGKIVKCAYDTAKKCIPNCAACEINDVDSFGEKVTCLRGPFIFGEIA